MRLRLGTLLALALLIGLTPSPSASVLSVKESGPRVSGPVRMRPQSNFSSPLVVALSRSTLSWRGGVVEVSARTAGATNCQLRLLGVGGLSVFYSSQPSSECRDGVFRAQFILGKNYSKARHGVTVNLIVREGDRAEIGRGFLVVNPRAVPTPVSVNTPIPGLGRPVGGPVAPVDSANWSGYVAASPTSFTGVTGTFTVPALSGARTCNQDLSQWVGLDGLNNSRLIQAGVEEYTGEGSSCASGTYEIRAWWEILPAYETPVIRWSDGSTALVRARDQVRVSLVESIPEHWTITIADLTTHESFTTTRGYSGPASSADWIVENPDQVHNYQCTLSDGLRLCPLPTFAPAVTFTTLGVSDAAGLDLVSEWSEITMIDSSKKTLATPSPLGSNSEFSVSFAGTGSPTPHHAP